MARQTTDIQASFRNVLGHFAALKRWRLGLWLVVALVLGGTSQDIISLKLPLYILSLIMIGLVLTDPDRAPMRDLWCAPVLWCGALIGAFILYSVPLPPEIWGLFEGRESIAQAYALAGTPKPWLPISLSPEVSLLSLLDFLPVIVVGLLMRLSCDRREMERAERVIIAAALGSLALGFVQIYSNLNPYTVYDFTNAGFPVGMFTNINHQACLLAMALPLAVYYAAPSRASSRGRDHSGRFALGICGAALLPIGLFLAGSAAGYGLGLFALAASVFWLNRRRLWAKIAFGIGAVVALATALNVIGLRDSLLDIVTRYSVPSETSRAVIFDNTWRARGDFGVFGTGPGSFEKIYPMYEDIATMTKTYANHTHNDWLQMILEFGVIGWALMGSALIWMVTISAKIITSQSRTKPRAAIIVIALWVPILHSAADYPLRTMGLATLTAFFALRASGYVSSRGHA